MLGSYAYLIGSLENGGQERQLYNLLFAFKKIAPREAYVIVWNDVKNSKYHKPITDLGYEVIVLKGVSKKDKIVELRSWVVQYAPETLHSFALYLNFSVYLATRKTTTIGIGALRSGYYSGFKMKSLIQRSLGGLFPKFKISNNEKGARELRGIYTKLGFDPNNVRVVRNKLDISQFADCMKFEIKQSFFTTGSMGSLTPIKRWDILIEVIEQLVQEGYHILHKHAGTGRLYDDLKKMVDEKKLNDNFKFIGPVKDVSAFYNDKYILFHTADSEGSSNVIMEAQTCGVPVITTRCGDVGYLIEDNKTGYITDIRDTSTLASKAKILLDNTELRNQMSNDARAKSILKFDLRAYVEEIDNAYLYFKRQHG